ncbi:unnamed protein product [Macrosiphum euphorbiae]|uniref:Uncharacterized protein n=1 Tax=Macrosiphum euphorbiae TaxID=13131 RepID=A0AAV0VUM3_9HEMI|nr:unnamed protein product [Macrosiphum euphorbiae]
MGSARKPRKKPKRRLILMKPEARCSVTPAESDQFYWAALIDERTSINRSRVYPPPATCDPSEPSPPSVTAEVLSTG